MVNIRNMRGIRKSKNIPNCVRWLGAFRGFDVSISDSIDFELNPNREIAGECFFSKSLIRAKVGLLLDTEKSLIRTIFCFDGWTELDNSGKLKHNRNRICNVSTLNRVEGMLKKINSDKWDRNFYMSFRNAGRHTEAIITKPIYKGIVIKEKTPKAILIANEFSKKMNIPIIEYSEVISKYN